MTTPLPRRSHRRPTRPAGLLTIAVLLVAFCAAIIWPTSAWAHSGLVSSDPEDGATLNAAPTSVSLTFNEDINPKFATIAVTRTDGGDTVAMGTATVNGPVLAAPVTGSMSPGTHRVGFRVVSKDGHPISGELSFTIAGTRTGSSTSANPVTPNPRSPQTTSAPAAGSTGTPDAPAASAGSSKLPTAIVALVALALLVVGAFLVLRRPRP